MIRKHVIASEKDLPHMQKDTKLSVAIFAHNISGTVSSCVKNILKYSHEKDISVYILANGCTDSTEKVALNLQNKNSNVHLVSIPVADKANAWNYYVYKLAPAGALHFFIDGDIEVQPDALLSISEAMNNNPNANAVGGVPVVGRDRLGWTKRMISCGRVSGGLYALRDNFINRLRQNEVKLPVGFIGEDFLVSALAKDMLSLQGIYTPSPLLHIETQAGFSFRQLSPLSAVDYLAFFRRLIRYRIRDYQLSMLMNYVNAQRTHVMPMTVEKMYENTHLLPRYYWRGRLTIIDWLAVFKIRNSAGSTSDNNN